MKPRADVMMHGFAMVGVVRLAIQSYAGIGRNQRRVRRGADRIAY